MEYEVQGEWKNNKTEWVYEAKAVNKAGRLLAKVNAFIEVDTKADLVINMGPDAITEIEKAAKENLDTIVKQTQQQTN